MRATRIVPIRVYRTGTKFMTYDNTSEQQGWLTYRVGQGILIEDGKILLSGNRWYSGKPLVWTLPGGRAEEGEATQEAVVREFREETGLEVETLELAYVAESRSLLNKRLFLVCAFVVRRISGELQSRDAAVEALQFVLPAELDTYLPAPSLGGPLRFFLQNPDARARYWYFPEYQPGD
jgi:8-oxo-dGTP diphosphatase